MHIRRQVRDALKIRLDTVLAGHDVTVYSGRVVKFRLSELDAVNVFPPEDAAVGTSPNGHREDRQIDIAIAILIAGTREDALNRADEIAEIIEPGMVLSKDWQIPVVRLEYSGSDISQVVGADGEIVALTLRYFAGVALSPGNPSQNIVNAQPLR